MRNASSVEIPDVGEVPPQNTKKPAKSPKRPVKKPEPPSKKEVKKPEKTSPKEQDFFRPARVPEQRSDELSEVELAEQLLESRGLEEEFNTWILVDLTAAYEEEKKWRTNPNFSSGGAGD